MPALIEVRRLEDGRQLRLTWSDGHTALYGADYLRGWCPCAGCQGHTGLKIRYLPPPAPVAAAVIKPVGNYAISFAWSDGHGTGIYRFDFLRQICPCERCGGNTDSLSTVQPVAGGS
ncbi:MAG: DUF971 domain-containing protein [Acidobacteriota bacterium]|nr:DUF971 domain-containing protein [Acidobacteriota bacterium]